MRRIVVLVQFLTAAALVAFWAAGTVAQSAPTAQGTQGQGRGGAQPDPWPGTKKLLAVADVQTGFHHDSISHALATVERIGRESGAQKDPLPEDAGKDTVIRVCGGCHSIDTAVSTRGSEKEWREVVDLMIERGAMGTEEDFRTVVGYLAKHFGAKR